MQKTTWIRRRFGDYRKLREAARVAGVGLPISLWRFADLTVRRRFSPSEIFLLGLLDGRLSNNPDAAISNEELLDLQRALNAGADPAWTEDKLEFHRRCVECGLPVPRLLAVMGQSGAKIDGCLQVTSTEELAAAVASGKWPGVVLKPIHGVHGHGVLALECAQGFVRAPDGRRYRAGDLVAHMRSAGYASWIVQDRLWPHPELEAVTHATALSTFRIPTLLQNDGTVVPLYSRIRLAAAGASVDNWAHGTSGNVVGNVSMVSGETVSVIKPRVNGVGYDRVDRHPGTGYPLIAWQPPLLAEALELAQRAALAFPLLKTVGWDIAISRQGVFVIEGNMFWDVGIEVIAWPEVLSRLRVAAGAS